MSKLIKSIGVSAVALSTALYAASVSDGVSKDGIETSDLKNFSKVKLNTSSDIKITVGNDYSIEMTGDEDRIKDTELSVSNDTLIIKNKKRFLNFNNIDNDMLITVTMPNIVSMQINGSGDGEIIGVNNKELSLNINGSGDLNVSGKTEELEISINGSGNINMDEVIGKDVEIEINGSGDVALGSGTCQKLEIEIHGSGDVDAKNLQCEDVDVDISGSGDSIVYASNSLTFDSYGSGNVDVYGKPKNVNDKTAKRNSRINIR